MERRSCYCRTREGLPANNEHPSTLRGVGLGNALKTAAMSASDTIIETEGLSKSFKGFWAVRNVNLKVRRGTIHALIGPNGAGKTTCFNLITKFLQPTVGTIRFNGRDITARRSRLTLPASASSVASRSRRLSRIFHCWRMCELPCNGRSATPSISGARKARSTP